MGGGRGAATDYALNARSKSHERLVANALPIMRSHIPEKIGICPRMTARRNLGLLPIMRNGAYGTATDHA